MKLAFPNGEHDDLAIGKGSFSIGSSEKDDIVIGAEQRAILTVDQRGITLTRDDGNGGEIMVNARPVREKAILRLGDHIRIGAVDMVLRSEDVKHRTPPFPFEALSEDLLPAKIHLRGISGHYSGAVFPVRDTVTLGADDTADIRIPAELDIHLSVGWKDDQVYVKREGGQGVLDVNGHQVKHAQVKAGDQIAVGEERFLVEAPSFVPGEAYSGEAAAEGGSTQVFSAAAFQAHREQTEKNPQPTAKGEERSASPAGQSGEKLRDALIIGVCVALSTAMLIWLYMNL